MDSFLGTTRWPRTLLEVERQYHCPKDWELSTQVVHNLGIPIHIYVVIRDTEAVSEDIAWLDKLCQECQIAKHPLTGRI